MRQFFRAIAWLLLVCGLAIGGLAAMNRFGSSTLGVDIFGGGDTPTSDTQRMMAGTAMFVVALLLLRVTRRDWTTHGHR